GLLFTRDGKQLVSASKDKTIRVWDVRTGEVLRVLRPPIGPGEAGTLYSAALSPDGRTLGVAGVGLREGEAPIYLLAFADGRIENILRGHTGLVRDLAFSPDGRQLASGSYHDLTARLWDLASGACQHVLKAHTGGILGIAFAPDGRRLATASQDG